MGRWVSRWVGGSVGRSVGRWVGGSVSCTSIQFNVKTKSAIICGACYPFDIALPLPAVIRVVHAIVSQSVGRSVVCLFFGLVVPSFVRSVFRVVRSGRSFGSFVCWFVRSVGRSAGRASQPASHWSFGKVGLSVCQSD